MTILDYIKSQIEYIDEELDALNLDTRKSLDQMSGEELYKKGRHITLKDLKDRIVCQMKYIERAK